MIGNIVNNLNRKNYLNFFLKEKHSIIRWVWAAYKKNICDCVSSTERLLGMESIMSYSSLKCSVLSFLREFLLFHLYFCLSAGWKGPHLWIFIAYKRKENLWIFTPAFNSLTFVSFILLFYLFWIFSFLSFFCLLEETVFYLQHIKLHP